MLTTGVYTVECPKCKSFTIIHLASDGSVNPHRCSKCELEFEGIGSGKKRHSLLDSLKKLKEPKKLTKNLLKPSHRPKKLVKSLLSGKLIL